MSSTEERAKKDFFLIKKLRALLDSEKGLLTEEAPFQIPETVDSAETKKYLDLLIVYLRKVHFYDYYSAIEFETEDALLRKCGDFPVRTRSTEAVPDGEKAPSQQHNNHRMLKQQKTNHHCQIEPNSELGKELGFKG